MVRALRESFVTLTSKLAKKTSNNNTLLRFTPTPRDIHPHSPLIHPSVLPDHLYCTSPYEYAIYGEESGKHYESGVRTYIGRRVKLYRSDFEPI